MVLGSGDYKYERVEGWAKIPEGSRDWTKKRIGILLPTPFSNILEVKQCRLLFLFPSCLFLFLLAPLSSLVWDVRIASK